MKEKILEVVDLCKEYPVKRGALLPKEIGMVHAVNHVSFTLYQGETLGIIGESGCGKTTLIRMLRKRNRESSLCWSRWDYPETL